MIWNFKSNNSCELNRLRIGNILTDLILFHLICYYSEIECVTQFIQRFVMDIVLTGQNQTSEQKKILQKQQLELLQIHVLCIQQQLMHSEMDFLLSFSLYNDIANCIYSNASHCLRVRFSSKIDIFCITHSHIEWQLLKLSKKIHDE